MSELTVRQALTFASRLRLSGTSEFKQQRVEELLGQMHLNECADVRIGGGLVRGVSGGQRKRVCIATELIARPTFLFCDEPTSGLDSETALVIIGVLQALTTEAGMCIICSIHQPSSQVYSQFDDLCFLDGGRCVYFGKAGDKAIDHFSGLANAVCPPKYNPPDWFMEQAVNGKFSGVKFAVEMDATFHSGSYDDQDPGFAVPFLEQVAVIFERSWVKVKVEKLNGPFYLQNVSIGVIAGCLFSGLQNRESDIFPRVSFSFNFLMGSLYLPIMEVLFVFLQDSLTLRKDILCKAHHPLAYYVAKILSVSPILAILLAMMTVSIYTLAFYNWFTIEQFLALISAQFVIGNVFAGLGICIAAFVKSPAYLMTTTLILLVWLFTFAGFFVPTADINPALRWMVAINPASYGFALFFQIVLLVGKAPSFKCDKLSVYDTCDDPNNRDGLITPEDVLEYYNMDTPISVCFGVLIGMYVVTFVLGYYFFYDKISLWLK